MDDLLRKKIIIKEISEWKQSRLLPESYCDFLLSLYTEGNNELIPTKDHKNYKSKTLTVIISLVSFILLTILFLFLVTYFTEINLNLQMLINCLFIIICFLFGYFYRENRWIHHFSLIVGALLVLIFSIQIVEIYFPNQYAIFLTIIVHCLAWFIIGLKSTKRYFLIASAFGLIITIIAFFK
ncbi:hypothetical protein [Litchfieldia alkalitelluris]|uniref:hypothetical protein n=1 Tax=Litchfieldia alkalitelluris TaxID=304268 RepID=UPI001115C9E6|nr:hypothetical protein [Litchfieldia alkalitelluris]